MRGKPHVYAGSEVTVTFDSNVCIHAGNCVRELPSVFKFGEKPWARPDNAPAEEVVAQVGRCPSGALQVVEEAD